MNMKHILQNCWFQKLCVSGYSMSGVTRSELTVTSRRELEPQVEVQCQNWKTQQYIRLPPFVLNIQIQARSFWASAITNLSRAKRCHFSPLFIHTTHGDIWQGGQIGQNWAASQVTSGQNNKNCRHCEQWPFPVARFEQAALWYLFGEEQWSARVSAFNSFLPALTISSCNKEDTTTKESFE